MIDNSNDFIEDIAKINNDRISVDEYKKIEKYFLRRLYIYGYQIKVISFMLNEIKKYTNFN